MSSTRGKRSELGQRQQQQRRQQQQQSPPSEQRNEANAEQEQPGRPAEYGQQPRAAGNGEQSSASVPPTKASRLVFGLSSRTNRLKHDEYAERRNAGSLSSSSSSSSYNQNSNGANRAKPQEHIAQSSATCASEGNRSPLRLSCALPAKAMSENGAPPSPAAAQAAPDSDGKQRGGTGGKKSIRPSRYGNFYKPQDLAGPESEAALAQVKESPKLSVKQNEQPSRPASSERPTGRRANSSPIRQQKSKENLLQEAASKPAASLMRGSEKCEERAVVEQQAHKPPATKMQFNIPPPPQVSTAGAKSSVVSYAKSRIYDKPARQLSSPSGDHLRYQHSALGSLQGAPSLLNSGAIPESILSGFKPPKQVNVSKACEKWEGGEPFARTKSRQRLAVAQAAGKKLLLHGTWSMTSVVATQQLQLQQALANSSAPVRSNVERSDPAVKILTRGSVLERVQQFEKAPGAVAAAAAAAVVASSVAVELLQQDQAAQQVSSRKEDFSDIQIKNTDSSKVNLDSSQDGSRSPTTGPVTKAEAAAAFAGATSSAEKTISRTTSQISVTPSKQAQYKTRVSSIQISGAQQRDQLAAICGTGGGSPTSPGGGSSSSGLGAVSGLRRPSLRRRSSTTSATSGSDSSSSIPKFYHPYGKPNTYEIELQKKNIVACFDKFPDRKAQLTSPNYKRHFHAISLACGFSEYFKEPLYLYVRHQMNHSNLLHQPTATRKQSGAGLVLVAGVGNNNTSNAQVSTSGSERLCRSGAPMGAADSTPSSPSSLSKSSPQKPQSNARPLIRAASIDTSTMERIQSQTYISCEQFLVCWRNIISSCFDTASRFVHLLTYGQRNHLIPDDFVPLIQSIIDDHPGLKFLRAAPDFHMRYIQTVIARIYYCINRSWTGKITLSELRRSNLLAVLLVLSQEEDINQITDYFSYEHFYVIYCKFWSLDQDHDLLISKEDLARHNDAAISSRIIDRIFSGVVSKQIRQTGKMSYSDFVWFLLAEEDKKHPRSIEYWFRLMDFDGDGYISMYEMEYFYYEQIKRLELMNIEALPFLDGACQILDLVNPKEKNKISLSDLKRTKMATIFFDTFINLEKYLEHESREFVSTRDVVQDGVVISDWDRYASEEYESLVTEESAV